MAYKVLTDGNGSKLIRVVGMGDFMPLADYNLIQKELEELKAQLVPVQQGISGVSFTKTGAAPCANFCEAVATRKMFQRWQDETERHKREKAELVAQVAVQQKVIEYADNKLYILSHNRKDISARLLVDADKAFKVVRDHLNSSLTPPQYLNQIKEDAGKDAERFSWLSENLTEKVIQNQSEYVALKTKYELPTLIAYADFCGQISFREAVDIAMKKSASIAKAGE